MTTDRIVKVLRKDVQRIEQLADMVNTYAERLGLGKKVNAGDWTEEARALITKIDEVSE